MTDRTTLRFHGAAQTVTGSCHEIDTGKARVLVDCGMFQGSKTLRELNYGEFPFDPAQIDAVILTHAHIDHSGLLPKLMKYGFRGRIHSTVPTVDLCNAMLPDSGHIQESEVDRLNARNRRRGKPEVLPIYTEADAYRTMKLFSGHGYDEWFSPVPGIRVRFWNAGHILGSASPEICIGQGEGEAPLQLAFSGDIGPDHKLLQPDPEAPAGCDYLICESTFGDRDRLTVTAAERRQRLATEVREAAERGGALLIPSFALERTQEVVTDLMTLIDEHQVPNTSVFIDSPLAREATKVFLDHTDELENADRLKRAFNHPSLRFSITGEDSKALGRLSGFHIIVAASGMCDAGRIRHHLKNHLWQRNATVLIVGYQAQATLGRLLLDGAKRVRIHGEDVKVKATIRSIDQYSGHADGTELAQWINARAPVRRGIFLTHGEGSSFDGLKHRVPEELIAQDRIIAPRLDQAFDITGPAAKETAPGRKRLVDEVAATDLDWHNDLTKLILDINEQIEDASDEKARGVILRRLRKALETEGKAAR